MQSRAVTFVAALVLLVTACSLPQDARPPEFDLMTTDEVGCTLKYGDNPLYVVGPLGARDSQEIEPNDWTYFRFFRTPLDIGVVTKTPRTESHGGTSIDNLPEDGILDLSAPVDAGYPGYTITCWRGEA